ncbi:type IX secretion system periplasmic lipoprotein PorW/SprE [Fibrella arboris]|uniref:type IX secretion system periplasmic lipoprotein PorW/SprE n=1 Tax=Fibrella arboris TaxID=3242486 RepID=UPI0035202BFC
MYCFRPVYFTSLGLLALLAGGFWSCSQHSNGTVSKGYHNLTAHFNAYVMARDDIDEVERYLFKNRQENYNETLPILVPLDSNAIQSVRPQLDDAIKKASLVAERHQNSKWVDNAYVLIGKTRLYRQDLPNAIEVFKYVNTKGTDDADKHEALILLMRAYTETGDFANGLTVAEYLRTQPLTKTNTRDFYLTKANLHQRKGEALIAAGILEATFPFLKKSEATARLHLIAGQLYESAGKATQATEQFQQVLRTHPNYDQEFFANIYLMQADGTDSRQLARNAERFEEMLNDRKNSDLKDKIYFTMGRADARRGNYDRALVNFNKAVQTGLTNTAQVALTYAEIGNLYFEKKRDYSKAQAYYDSSLALLPQNNPAYTTLANRKKSLDEFVNNQTTIDREDSLQRMAQMNPAALDQLLDKIIDQREKDDAAQAELARQITGRTNLSGAQATNSDLAPNDRWVLYNPVQLAQGKQEFMQLWGNRPLADDWRRQNKDASQAIASETSALNGANPANSTNPATPLPAAGARPPVANTLNLRKAKKDELYRQIPFSADALQKSNDQLESALFRQGKLYKFQLDQPLQAMTTLDRLLVRYPNSSYKPEAYYLMHLSAEQAGKPSPWRDKLLTEFPTSSYAKLLTAAGSQSTLTSNTENGKGGVNEIAANQTYTNLYELYQSGNSTEALARVEAALGTFGGSKIADKMALLRIVLIGRVQGVDAYRQALTEFVRDYPLSPLLSHIKERQAAAEQLSAKRNKQ